MKSILLIGLGRFGKNVARKLNELHHEVFAVDINEERVNDIMPFVTNAQIGDSTDEDFLRTLGVRNFDCCFVAIGDRFQDSLETTDLLKELGAKMVISRACSGVHAKFLRRAGADEIVYPEKQLAEWAAIRYSTNHVLDYIAVSSDCAIYEVEVPTAWAGRTISQIDVRRKYGVNILAMRENGELRMTIKPDMVLDQDSTLLVLGENKNIQKCFHLV